MLVGATQTMAQTNYGLKIAGVDVTSENCNDLSVIPGVSGTVKYVPETKTLYLENATISVTDETANGIVKDSTLTIVVTGENTITSNATALKLGDNKTYIKGSGTLNVQSLKGNGVESRKAYLEINQCTMDVKGAEYGFYGDTYLPPTIWVRNAKLTAFSKYPSYFLINLTIEGCAITAPEDAAFDPSWHCVMVKNNQPAASKTIVIEPTTNYDIYIAGVKITPENCDDLSVIPGVSGNAKYDPAAKTIYLGNATIENEKSGGGIVNISVNPFLINVTGENTIATYNSAVSSAKPLTIKGNGTLNAESKNNCGIYLGGGSLNINSATVNAKGKYGIIGSEGAETFTVYKANVTAEGIKGSVYDFTSLALDGSVIVQPNGATYNETQKSVVLDGKKVTDKVVIEKITYYGLEIAGVDVTNENCNDLSVIPGVSGTVKYDPETKTLTLDNATIDIATTESFCILNDTVNGLTINVTGENNLNSKVSSIYLYKSTTINGGGTLNITAYIPGNSNSGIYITNDTLAIEKCTVNISLGCAYGIFGCWKAHLIMREANLTVGRTYVGAIHLVKSFTLEGCKISSPADAVFNNTTNDLEVNGKATTQVEITYDETVGIKDGKASVPAHKQGFYSIDGVYFGNDFNTLPKGIYIKDGKKVLK